MFLDLAEALSRSTDYRVLRRLLPRTTSAQADGQDTKIGVLLDTETTGLDQAIRRLKAKPRKGGSQGLDCRPKRRFPVSKNR
jgi:hypothetical protein